VLANANDAGVASNGNIFGRDSQASGEESDRHVRLSPRMILSMFLVSNS
jgi:hypothetical protein